MLSRKFTSLFSTLAATTAILTGSAVNAYALDTTEPLDPGTLEIDPTLTLDNLHDGKPCFTSDLSIGFGILDNFTIYGTMGYGSTDSMTGGQLNLGISTIWTPIDGDNVDLDVLLDFTFNGGYAIVPGFELNYDMDNDQSGFGAYLRFGLPIYGGWDQDAINECIEDGGDNAECNEEGPDADFALSFDIGLYYTIMEGHQVFVQGGFTAQNLAKHGGEREVVANPLALGYNAVINDSFELTTELGFNIPKSDSGEEFSAYLSVGGIFGMLGK